MAQSGSKPNQTSKMTKLLSPGVDRSPLSHLRRGYAVPKDNGNTSNNVLEKLPSADANAGKKDGRSKFSSGEYQFMPAFWTVASITSFVVNIILIILVVLAYQNFRTINLASNDIGSSLLGGLYSNFVKMDQAHITTTIPISKEIPVMFTLNVSGPTNVTLTDNIRINGALVTVNTGGLNISNAAASIVLPKGTVLPIYIDNLAVPVDQKVLAELNVPVDIPLNQTQLHEPFVGLQEVIKPFYCMIEPYAQFNGVNVCQ